MYKNLIYKLVFLLFFLLLPLTVGYKLSNLSVSINYFSSVFVFFYPYLLIRNLTFKKIYWFVFSLIILAWSLTETLQLLQEKSELNYLALKIFYESNPRELLEYFKSVVPWWGTAGALVVIFLCLYALLKFRHINYHFNKVALLIITAFFGIMALFYVNTIKQTENYFGFLKNEFTAQNELNQYYTKIKNKEAVLNAFFEKNQFNYKPKSLKNTYVLIIGESTSRHHLGLYGYFRNTNPLLSKRNDISVYDDVISSNTSTIECLGKCLTIGKESDVRNLSDPNIIDIANKAGLKTFWFSNQNETALYCNSISETAKRAAYSKFMQNGSSFDGVLLPEIQNALADSAQNKLIIVQLIGTHFEYKQRFPKEFEKFKIDNSLKTKFTYANTEAKLEKVNDYDNAVLYNDFVINSIFEMLSAYKNKENISAIYFSDHADEVYDTRDFVGHTPQGGYSFLHDIPFVTWNILKAQNQHVSFQMNNFIYSLLDWMDFENVTISESMFSLNFKPKIRTLANGKSYEKFVFR